MVLATKHKEHQRLDLKTLRKKLATPVLIDGRNVFDDKIARNAGFTYKGVGKGKNEE